MKKLIALLSVYLLCTLVVTLAFTGCGDSNEVGSALEYEEITENGKTVAYSVKGIGEETDTDIVIPSTHNKKPVTSIADNAFRGCDTLTSITVPNSITSIGSRAFEDCKSLKYNEYDNAYYIGNKRNPYLILMKAKDKSIKSCTINNNTEFIYDTAFFDCIDLENITMPDGLMSIGYGAFYYCQSLKTVIIPDSVKSIGGSAFYNCNTLTSINIPKNVTEIKDGAFQSCTALTSIIIPDGVTGIGDAAFSDCRALSGVTIPNGVKSIGVEAFCGCSALTSITIPESVTSIGAYAFSKATENVVLENTDGWSVSKSSDMSNSISVDVSDPAIAIECLTETYWGYFWRRG